MIFCDHQSRGLYVSLILIWSIDNFVLKNLNMFEKKGKKKIYARSFRRSRKSELSHASIWEQFVLYFLLNSRHRFLLPSLVI